MWYWNPVDCNEALPGVHDLTGCVEMDDDNHPFKTQDTPSDKLWGSDENGYPVLSELPPLTAEDNIAAAELKKASLLAEASSMTGDWKTELELGIISDEDKASLIIWLAYIKALKALDTSSAPDISWPTPPQ
ncbi:TPA: tail fiber assembly protein [Citrobacter koseri]